MPRFADFSGHVGDSVKLAKLPVDEGEIEGLVGTVYLNPFVPVV